MIAFKIKEMGKKKCSAKQLAALARGRKIRQKQLTKKTKSTYKRCPTKRSKKRTGEEYGPDGNPIEILEEEIPYDPPEIEPYQEELWEETTHKKENKKEEPKIELQSKPKELATPQEAKQDKKNAVMFAKIKKKLETDPALKNKVKNEKTVKVAYNGVSTKVPISMLPKNATFWDKYGGQIKDLAMLGIVGYGFKKVLNGVNAITGTIQNGWNGVKDTSSGFLNGVGNLINYW